MAGLGQAPADAPLLLPGAVLFACNFNQVRSPMAEALLKRLVGDRLYVDSCGLKRPARVHDDVADLEDSSFDLVVSLTPEAQHRAVELARGRAAEIAYWPTFDPTLTDGSREARLQVYREVRDALARRIAERFGRRPPSPIDLAPPGAL